MSPSSVNTHLNTPISTTGRLLWAAAAVAVLAALWQFNLQPTWRALQRAPAQQAQLESELLRMRALAQEASAWKTASVPTAAQAQQALRSATQALGAQARITTQGEQAVVSVQGVASQTLQTWLADVRLAARAQVVQVQLTRAATGWSGTVTLVVPQGGR